MLNLSIKFIRTRFDRHTLTKWNERITGVLNVTPAHESTLRDALLAGRVAKFAEDYETALTHFDQALEIANDNKDAISLTGIVLHRAETLMRLKRFEEAETFIAQSRANTSAPSVRAMQTAYLDCMAGVLAQAQGDLVKARTLYESALETAKTAATSGAEGRALGHLADTYLREGNASYAIHLLREALPKLSAASDLELSSYFVGLLGQSLAQSGQETEGTHLLGRAHQLAGQFNHRLYERHWAIILASRAMNEARYADAFALYQGILRLFNAEKPTPAYVITCAGLSKAALYLGDDQAALNYAEMAVASLDKLADAPLDPPVAIVSPTQIAPLARGMLGETLRTLGRSDEAIPHLEMALESSEVAPAQIDILRNLAAARANTGEMDAVIALYQRAITLAKKFDDLIQAAQAQRDLGLAYQQHGRLTEAIQSWNAALMIYLDKNAYAQIARLQCDIANARKALGQISRAIKDYEQALMTLNSVDQADFETRGLVLSNVAIAYAEQGDAETADAFFNDSIKAAQQIGDKVADATRSGNYGWFLTIVGRPQRALNMLERALQLSESLGLKLQSAIQMDNIGLAYDARSEYTQALEHHRKALDTLKDVALKPSDAAHWSASIQLNLANSLLSLNEFEESALLLENALQYGRESDKPALMIRALTGQARALIQQGNLPTATPILEEAIALARKTDSRRLLAELLYWRSVQLAKKNRHAEAYEVWGEARKLYTMLHMPQAKLEPQWLNTR